MRGCQDAVNTAMLLSVQAHARETDTGYEISTMEFPNMTDSRLTVNGPITISGENELEHCGDAVGVASALVKLRNLTIETCFPGPGIDNGGVLTIANSTISNIIGNAQLKVAAR